MPRSALRSLLNSMTHVPSLSKVLMSPTMKYSLPSMDRSSLAFWSHHGWSKLSDSMVFKSTYILSVTSSDEYP